MVFPEEEGPEIRINFVSFRFLFFEATGLFELDFVVLVATGIRVEDLLKFAAGERVVSRGNVVGVRVAGALGIR